MCVREPRASCWYWGAVRTEHLVNAASRVVQSGSIALLNMILFLIWCKQKILSLLLIICVWVMENAGFL